MVYSWIISTWSYVVKYGLDKRVGMLVVNLAGVNEIYCHRNFVGTAIPTAFVGGYAVAMYVPIALALYTLTNKSTPHLSWGHCSW